MVSAIRAIPLVDLDQKAMLVEQCPGPASRCDQTPT